MSDAIYERDGSWYHTDECQADEYGPFVSRDDAQRALNEYWEFIERQDNEIKYRYDKRNLAELKSKLDTVTKERDDLRYRVEHLEKCLKEANELIARMDHVVTWNECDEKRALELDLSYANYVVDTVTKERDILSQCVCEVLDLPFPPSADALAALELGVVATKNMAPEDSDVDSALKVLAVLKKIYAGSQQL